MKEKIRTKKRSRRRKKIQRIKNIRNNNTPNQLKWKEDVDPETGNLKFGESTAEIKEDPSEEVQKNDSGNLEFG